MILNKAILILGPTGSGKTPLGALIEKKGLAGRRCFHFDFGENLRAIGKSNQPDKHFLDEEIAFINKVLDSNALLEDKDFPLACKILDWFIERHHIKTDDLIILNGLPRHIGQAKGMDSILEIEKVILLNCTSEAVRARIRKNAGGDRSGRADDSAAEVENKINLFSWRTPELLRHYRSAGKEIITIEVRENDTAEDMLKALNNHP
ncbi:MAG: nucleoside monophosphate kinase [Planctomycetota bacterium]